MDQEKAKKIIKIEPDYFRRSQDDDEDLPGFHFSCGPGWYNLLFDLVKKLSSLDVDVTVQQIKEKFGTLRFYASVAGPDRSYARAYISKAKRKSAITCEKCGDKGRKYVINRWHRVRCKECVKEHVPDVKLDEDNRAYRKNPNTEEEYRADSTAPRSQHNNIDYEIVKAYLDVYNVDESKWRGHDRLEKANTLSLMTRYSRESPTYDRWCIIVEQNENNTPYVIANDFEGAIGDYAAYLSEDGESVQVDQDNGFIGRTYLDVIQNKAGCDNNDKK